MSKRYSDLDCNFPESVDNIDKMQDLTVFTKPMADEYYQLVNAGKIQEANEYLANNAQLTYSIFNAVKFNKLRDSIIAVQRMFVDDINEYLGELHDLESIDGGTY